MSTTNTYRRAFHGTSKAALPSILKEGLRPGGSAGADSWATQMLHKDFKRTADYAGVYLSGMIGVAATFSQFAAQVRQRVFGRKIVPGGVVLEIDLTHADPSKIVADDQFDYFGDDEQKAMIYQGPIPASWIKSYCEVIPEAEKMPEEIMDEWIEHPPLRLGPPVPVAA